MAEAMQPLSRCLALGEIDTEQARIIAPDAVVIRLLPPRARFSLRIDPSLLSNAKEIADFALNMPINRCTSSGERVAMRLGPDEWLLKGRERETAEIVVDVEAALAGLHHSLVDVGHRHVALSVSGSRAADVINSGCPLAPLPATFSPGNVARTLLAKAEILLSRDNDTSSYEIECARSFAAYVRDFLCNAARQYRASA